LKNQLSHLRLQFPVDASLVAGAIVVVETARSIRAEDAVLTVRLRNFNGLKIILYHMNAHPIIQTLEIQPIYDGRHSNTALAYTASMTRD
jgi:hypothetical protein